MENQLISLRYRRIKLCIWIVIGGLFLSGVTAFPLERELKWLVGNSSLIPQIINRWLAVICSAVTQTNIHYPYLSYGTDWLAFAHLLLALLFVGPLKDPVKNIWVIEFGIIAYVLIFPLAVIAGSIREIPFFWRLIDCSFGLIGIIPLAIAYKNAKIIGAAQQIQLNNEPAI